MTNEFMNWLAANGLSEVFTTHAGDVFYTNPQSKLGVILNRKTGNVQSFYLTDIIEIRTYDDENLVVEWNLATPFRVGRRSTRYSSNEVYMKIRLRSSLEIRLQVFKATGKNIKRDSPQHVNLFNYSTQISSIVYNSMAMAYNG